MLSLQQEQEATCSSSSLQKDIIMHSCSNHRLSQMMIIVNSFCSKQGHPKTYSQYVWVQLHIRMWQFQEEIEHYFLPHLFCVTVLNAHYSAELPGWSSCALHRCMTTCTWHAYSACTCMSPALKGNSVLQHIRCGKIIIHNRIIFNFYPELAHMYNVNVRNNLPSDGGPSLWHFVNFVRLSSSKLFMKRERLGPRLVWQYIHIYSIHILHLLLPGRLEG